MKGSGKLVDSGYVLLRHNMPVSPPEAVHVGVRFGGSEGNLGVRNAQSGLPFTLRPQERTAHILIEAQSMRRCGTLLSTYVSACC